LCDFSYSNYPLVQVELLIFRNATTYIYDPAKKLCKILQVLASLASNFFHAKTLQKFLASLASYFFLGRLIFAMTNAKKTEGGKNHTIDS